MARYLTEDEAERDGFRIEHEPDRHRFVVVRDADGGQPAVVGEAHYTLTGPQAIDFDHTVLDPSLRGSGLSGLLVHRALTDALVEGREIAASCWYVAGYLEKHPELRGAS